MLIVDDNEDIRKLIKSILGRDYTFLEAENGEIGKELALSHIPDLIISDIMMPVMDGYEFCRQIKSSQATSHIPVILLTAKTSRNSKLDGLGHGADLYLTKPFDAEELRLHVKNGIDRMKTIRAKYSELRSWQSIFTDLSNVDQDFVSRVDTYLKELIGQSDLSLAAVAQELTVSERQFRRKLKALTGQSPTQYIRSFKLKASKELLAAHQPISTVAYEVGFSSPTYFAKCFKDEFGMSAKEFLSQREN